MTRAFTHFCAAFLAVAMICLTATPGFAQERFENLDRLDSLVAMTVGANIGQPGGPVAPVDRRLRLAPCPGTPKIEGPQFGAAIVSCPAVGWRLRVPLIPDASAAPQAARAYGQPFGRAPAQVAAAPVVRKGDPVQLIAGNDSFSVSRPMIADEDGTVGATIRVREDPKATPVFARVEALGVVRVPGI